MTVAKFDYRSVLMKTVTTGLVTTAMMSAILGGFVSSAFAIKTENFNSAASAAANGWVAVGNGVDGQAVGWINSNEAGGAAGEAQFDVSRGGETSYADNNLGMIINGNGGFQMSGKLDVKGFVSGDTGFPPVLGFFSSPRDYVGIMFRAEAGINWGLRFETQFGGIIHGAGGDPSYHLIFGTPYDFTLSYDPNEGSFGTIRAHVIGAGPEIVYALAEGHRDTLNLRAFNKAGFFKRGNGFEPETLQLRADNLSYTGVSLVPEPSTFAMLALCGAAALGRRASRRPTVAC
jgi:hypothetical protein